MRTAKAVIFPLDKRWRVDGRGYSHGLNGQVLRLSGLVPFAEVARILGEVGQIQMGSTTIWEQTQRHGERLRQADGKQQAQVSVERTRWQHERYDPFLKRCVSIDGGMVCIVGEGWKELKVGLVSGFETDWQSNEASVHLTGMDYCAVLGEVDAFAPALWALAVKHEVPYAGKLVVVADGAQWIWRLTGDLFPVCTQILDYYHAKQHLAQVAHERHPDDAVAQIWYTHMSACLFQGEIWKIIADLQRPQLPISYFVNQKRRMQYQQFRADGFPIGSGGVESGVKQFKHRLCGAGMRWSRVGAERMVTLRTAVMADSFYDLWQQVA